MSMTAKEKAARLAFGAEEVLPLDELEKKLERSAEKGEPLRIKLGLDPTAPDIHLGHTVVLRKLRQFQELGHTAVLIIGDFTGRIGDPSGKSETRRQLTEEEVKRNAETYIEQFDRILIKERTELLFNSAWLDELDMAGVIGLTAKYTVARMLERDDFSKRYASGQPISIVEFMYPLLQGYDSVAVRADVELGGTDQKFNLLVGRDLQRAYGQEPQVILTLPLLEGTDGVQKMSKSLGNYIGVLESPEEMFGKTMSIADGLIIRYATLVSSLPPQEVAGMAAELEAGTNPSLLKRRLARDIVETYHGSGSGEAAEAHFDRLFKEKDAPRELATVEIPAELGDPVWLPKLIAELALAASNGEARRLIAGGGVKLDGEAVVEEAAEFPRAELAGRVLQVGKRKFVRLQ